jgi:hypothetical protein
MLTGNSENQWRRLYALDLRELISDAESASG